MNEEKFDFYKENSAKEIMGMNSVEECVVFERNEQFDEFIAHNAFDAQLIFNSMTFRNTSHYFYFGDLVTNKFYISDNMRDNFGFESNIVDNLLVEWEKRISTEEHLEIYRKDINDIYKYKKTVHDIRYQVRDIYGSNFWIRCCGIVKWNKDNTRPVYFSGRVSCQDNEFVIDATTNFPREHFAINRIEELSKQYDKIDIIGFCLNNFKEINEIKGRETGNRILRNIANRLSDNFGSKVSFYRLDGMRFMAIVTPSTKSTVENIIDDIRNIVESEYQTAGVSIIRPCAFGVINYKVNNGDMPQIMLENVINLISSAKLSIENTYIEHSSENARKTKENAAMALRLSQDVANNMQNFRIVIQPIVAADRNVIVKGEALLRWKYNDKNVSPAIFIPMLEKGNMILGVGKWIFEQAVINCKKMTKYDPNFKVAFNVSYLQIMNNDFINFIEHTLKKYNMQGNNFIAELTETHFDENPEKLKEFVNGCKKLGISIALDDFGNGYSSLGLLLKYPASVVKLDRSLLAELTESEDKMNFIRSIVYACHQFGKTVCVEGVETEEEDTIVKNTGCDMIQGYFHYKPIEVSELYEIIKSNSENK